MKGKDRIINQIKDSLEEIAQGDEEIIMTLPISVSKVLVKAIIQTLTDISKTSSKPLKVKILINSTEYQEIKDSININTLIHNFLVVDFELLKKLGKGSSINNSNNMFLDLIMSFEELFSSRPIFLVAGTEAAFIVIGDNNVLSCVKIQHTDFVSFQQMFLGNVYNLVNTFVKGTSLQN